MKMVVIGVYDKLLECFMPAQIIQPLDDAEIIESHRRAVKGGQIPFDKAYRYVLMKFGTFDDTKGVFELYKEPKKLVSLVAFVPKDKLADLESHYADSSFLEPLAEEAIKNA